MSIITVKDIRRIAEQESGRHNHYYIGVEHLFIAMTKVKNGVTNAVLEQVGIEPRFIRYTIRHEIGVNDDGRYWTGFRDTPRAKQVLETAQKYAGLHNPTEQHLLLAMLDEGDSIPTRVLEEHGVDLKALRVAVSNWSPKFQPEMPSVIIRVTDDTLQLSQDELAVIQRMFRAHQEVTVERELNGGFTGSRLLVVLPRGPFRIEARVVVKIGERSAILHEQRHYETYVRDTFPPTTARLLDNPALPEECPLGGLKYSLVKPNDSTDPIDLRAYANQITPVELGHLLRNGVYKVYAEALWWQRERYRFGVWREYEHVLPPALEVEFLDLKQQGSGTILEPLGTWSHQSDAVKVGQIVALRNFVVNKIRPNEGSIQLTAGGGAEAVNRASKVEVLGLGKLVRQFRRGEVVELVVGQVRRRRIDIMLQYAKQLNVPYDLELSTFLNVPEVGDLPNPLNYIDEFLERHVRGYLSLIHGDLHLGNILVGPAGDAWLIDFALVREGHTLFDWAMLEVSVLCTLVAPLLDDTWDGVWYTLRLMNNLNNMQYHMHWDDSPIAEALRAIAHIRETVQENLVKAGKWQEYHIALTMLALRGLTWVDTSSLAARRLLFGVAALSVLTTFRADAGQLTTGAGTREFPTDTHQRRFPNVTSDNELDEED